MGRRVIEIDGVSKRFELSSHGTSLKERFVHRERARAEQFWALRDISMSVDEGSTIGIMGRNGSGKSTLLKLVGGILKPTAGTVRVQGRIASLLELGAGMHPELTGRENIFMNGAILGMPKRELERRFDEIVEFAELEQFIDQQVKHYSSGMFIRLGFSVAVNVEPDLLLVDEVLAVGDENFQRKCLERVRRFQRDGRTIVVVSHSADQIRQICDQVAVIDHGNLVALDDPAVAIRVFREHLLEDELDRRARSEAEERPSQSLASEDIVDRVDEPVSAATHGAAQEAKRNLRVRIAGIEFDYAHKDERRYLLPGEALTITVRYTTDESIDDIVIGLGIFEHATGRPIYGTNTDILGTPLTTVAGAGQVTFEVSFLPLLDGTYPITVGIHSHDEATVYDWSEQRTWFEILSPDRTSGLVWMPVEAKSSGA
jgi:ABC-type polysaccharide/polyol phosphate transport system ATPase subunit